MTSLPEQFQAARQFQLDQQFSFLRNLGDQALDRTSRLVALNLDLSRAAVEHSSSTVRQLMAVRDPRDLLTIGAQSQRQLRTMFDYGHELFNIATGQRGAALRTWSVAAAAPAPALAAPVNVVESAVATVQEAVQETVNQTASATEQVAKQISEPAPVSVSAADTAPDTSSIVTSSIVPPVEPTPIAKATSEILDVPLAPHPVAASVPVDVDVEIELPKVEPVDATPPVAPPSNGAPKVTEIRSGRGRRKGN